MTRALLVAALAVAPLVVQAQEPVDTARLGPIVVTAERLPIPAARRAAHFLRKAISIDVALLGPRAPSQSSHAAARRA